MSNATGGAGPVTAAERIVTLDVLRGFALLGILLVNIAFFANPISDPFVFGSDANPFDRAAGWLVGFLAQGKFYPLFSLLFGLGFAMQLRRAEERGGRFASIYLRRLLVLLAIGVAHGVLIWAGDILTTYALLGFVLLLVGRGRSVWLLVLAGIAYAVQVLLLLGMSWSMQTAAACAPPQTMTENSVAAAARPEWCEQKGVQELVASFRATEAEMAALAEDAWRAYTGGGFAEITEVRVREFGMMLSNMGFLGAQILAMFLFGAWLGRRGVLERPDEHRAFFRNALVAGVLAGVPLSAWFASVNSEVDYTSMFDPAMAHAFMINVVAGPLLMLGYVGAIVLAMRTRVSRVLAGLAPVGRMALTNYLLQSVACTLIFYSYGLGLMSRFPDMPVQLGIVVAVFAAQVLFSHWWMARFAFGPVEWLWRTLTYLEPPPLRRSA